MVDKFILEFAKLIVDNPQAVQVSTNEVSETFCEITILADKNDTGKLIGKEGKMINAIKAVISGCKAKENRSYKIFIKANEKS